MKIRTKSSLIIGVFVFAMIFGVFTLIIMPTRADSHTFIVFPSGGDDTANIQAAFDAAIAAGPGSTVLLTSGQFYTNEIYIEDFYGTFKGAGIEQTKIDVLRGFDPTAPGVYGPMGTHIFRFLRGDVSISDLYFDITPYEPAEPWGLGWVDLLSPILMTGELNSRIENVRFTGHEGTSTYDPGHPLYLVESYNVRAGVVYGGGLITTGNHLITKCEFDSLWLGLTAYGLMNAEVKIKSNSITGGAIGIINAENDNSKFEISHNEIETRFFGGIWVMQPPPREPSQWLITHNIIRVLSLDADGIALMDYSPAKSLEAVISHNKIMLDDANWGGIWTYGLQDAFISNNIICGKGEYGIACAFAYNNLLLGNNVQNVDAYWASVALIFASGCVVVGGSTKTNVLDIGGDNNIIVGISNMQGTSPGPEIQEAMEQKRAIFKLF
ncbi:MAG: hypothetical protein EAX89_12555 [Candidatus Lokiarchaeota archaeon]|nr:hypothetical protein [Candidatus Lokiarchaeota archaeon]